MRKGREEKDFFPFFEKESFRQKDESFLSSDVLFFFMDDLVLGDDPLGKRENIDCYLYTKSCQTNTFVQIASQIRH